MLCKQKRLAILILLSLLCIVVIFSLRSKKSSSMKPDLLQNQIRSAKGPIIIKEEIMCRGDWLSLKKITYTDPRGVERTWETVTKTAMKVDGCNAVMVIAILKSLLKYESLVLVKQFRPPMGGFTLEFPAGLMGENETAEQAALRELMEETGFVGLVKHVSPGTSACSAQSSNVVRMITIEIDGDDSRNIKPVQNLEEPEFVEVIKIPMNELMQHLNDLANEGVHVDSRVYAYAIAMEQARKAEHIIP